MSLKDKMIRYYLMERHRKLVRGGALQMEIARKILHLLVSGEILLGLGDVDWAVEQELTEAGVPIRYHSSGWTAYARIRRPEC